MRIVSYNVNGIRAAMNKGLMDWLKTDPADVICVQETKAVKDQVNHRAFADLGYKFMHGHSSSPSDSGSHVSTESGSEGRDSDQLSRMTVHVLMCNPHSVFSKFFHRPDRGSSPGSTGAVQWVHPMLG